MDEKEYAEEIQCLPKATEPIGIKGQRKKRRRRKMAAPRAAAGYARQLTTSGKSSISSQFFTFF